MHTLPGILIGFAKTETEREPELLSGEVTAEGQRESPQSMGQEVKGIPLLPVSREGSGGLNMRARPGPQRAPTRSNQRSQGHSASAGSRGRAKMGRKGATSQMRTEGPWSLEPNGGHGERSHRSPLASSVALVALLTGSMAAVVPML